MFEDALIEQRIKTKRPATTAVSFLLQALFVAILVIIPLIFTEALPVREMATTLVAPPPPPPPPPAAEASAPHPVKPAPTPVRSELEVPVRIPQKVAMVHETAPEQANAAAAAPAVGGVVGGVAGGVEGGTIGGVVGGVLNGVGAAVPKLEAPKRVKVSSGVTQGLLTRKVEPQYPSLAMSAHIQGTVVLSAVIGKDGGVKQLQLVSGHPMLARAAESAVRQWRYRPYMLNGQPVEIDTTISVNFKLAG